MKNATIRQHVPAPEIRHDFSRAMSNMYAKEVPLYGKLLSLVNYCNNSELEKDEKLVQKLKATDNLDRITLERHGAICVGRPEELSQVRHVLRTMDMLPTGYYDLSTANLPVHATCFRPHKASELGKNPFRMFVSLLRLDLIDSDALRRRVMSTLSKRQIFSSRMFELLEIYDEYGGFTQGEAEELVSEATSSFRWHTYAAVSSAEYQQLLRESSILADIVAFKLPHINHLTPRALDIDAVQVGMKDWGIPLKVCIEGPPKRTCPILLRQTSFKAIEEKIAFPANGDELSDVASFVMGHHKARFGEIEQRGAALTPKGRQLYDKLLSSARKEGINAANGNEYAEIFADFPDSWEQMRIDELAWFRYYINEQNAPNTSGVGDFDLERGIKRGWICFEPLVYEDFLPVSAAGIFQSNLGNGVKLEAACLEVESHSSQTVFESALGTKVADEMALYRKMEEESLEDCKRRWLSYST